LVQVVPLNLELLVLLKEIMEQHLLWEAYLLQVVVEQEELVHQTVMLDGMVLVVVLEVAEVLLEMTGLL
jgi:hypothetical protein